MAKKPAAGALNLEGKEDPCGTQGDISLATHLMVAATAAGEGQLLDCVRDRNFRLRDLFPPRVIAEDEQRPDGWLAKFLDALDQSANDAFARVDCFPTIIDPLRTPPQFLDHLLYHLGNPFTLEEGLTDQQKRRLAMVLFALYALKGTCPGVVGAIRVIYGINVTECVSANVDCWDLDIDELDVDTILCPSNAIDKRTFQLMVDTNLSDTQRAQMTNIVNYMKAANEFFGGFIEPGNVDYIDHWEMDLSDLNENTNLH